MSCMATKRTRVASPILFSQRRTRDPPRGLNETSAGSMQRLYVANDLPDLRITQLDPGGHTLASVAIHQQPVEVSVGCLLLHAGAFQGRPLLGSIRVVAVAVGTVIEVDSAASSNRIRLIVIRSESLGIGVRENRKTCASGRG